MEEPLLECSLKERIREGLEMILAFCADACEARENACEGSAEWHKRTGEVLAYARMTSLLSRVEEAANRASHIKSNWTRN
jgi:hypothetical protein